MQTRPILHPVGPLPPRVYWTRRLFLLGGLAVVIAAVAVACSGGTSKSPQAASRPPSPSPSPSPTATPACSRGDLTVTVTTDAATYPAGMLPHLTVAVRNTGSRSCRFVDAASTRVWSIYSGTDQVWSDAGCNAGSPRVTRTLAPRGVVRHGLVWSRHRSVARPGTGCAGSGTMADPGTYRLYVTVHGERSAAAVFHLTG
jgi:hypothetical protein